MHKTTIALAQSTSKKGEVEANLQKHKSLTQLAAEKEALLKQLRS